MLHEVDVHNEDQVKYLRTPLLEAQKDEEDQIIAVGIAVESALAPASALEVSKGSDETQNKDQDGEEYVIVKKLDLLQFTIGIVVGSLVFAAIHTRFFTHSLTNAIDIEKERTKNTGDAFAILAFAEFAIRCLGIIHLVVNIVIGSFGDVSYYILGYLIGTNVTHIFG